MPVRNFILKSDVSLQKILVYWRDIPAQVIVKKGRDRGKVILSRRFQEAVDRAAMRAGKGGSDAYLADWRRESTEITFKESHQSAAKKIAEELERSFSDENIKALIKHQGLK